MRLSWLKAIGAFVLAATLSAPAWAANAALPGTLNYVEGQASAGDQSLNAQSIGSVNLQPGEKLDTENGKAEILLTPGVFLRVGQNSTAQMISSSLTNTEARIDKGQAMVEVAEIHKDNLLRIASDGATTQLLKDGLYGFDADNGQVQVFKGQALVQDGDQSVKVKGGREVDLNAGKLKARKFDKQSYEQSDLYRFSNLRSQYLAEANANAAGIYYAGGPGWYGPGWYWDPFFASYTWIPGAGVWYSPFGWGFYSPGFYYGGPFYYRGPYWHHGCYGHGYRYSHGPVGVAHGPTPRVGGARPAMGFHGGGGHFGIMGGGGFHGGRR
jgi:FecR protein